jgi:hypothetical protein
MATSKTTTRPSSSWDAEFCERFVRERFPPPLMNEMEK